MSNGKPLLTFGRTVLQLHLQGHAAQEFLLLKVKYHDLSKRW